MVEHIYPSLPLRKKKCYVTVRLLKKGNFAKCLRDPCSFTAVCKYMTYGGSWIFLDFVLFCSFDRLSNNFRIAFSYHDAPYNLISWWDRLHFVILNLENHQDENRLISPERVLLSCIINGMTLKLAKSWGTATLWVNESQWKKHCTIMFLIRCGLCIWDHFQCTWNCPLTYFRHNMLTRTALL